MLSNSDISDANNFNKSYKSVTNSQFIKEKIVRKIANIQDKLKTLAVISMLIDHIGLFLFPTYEIFRVIGRLAMPIFCFFAGYNFKGKRNSKLLKIGFLLLILTSIKNSGMNHFIQIPTLNILFSIYFGQFYLQKFLMITSDFISNILQLLPLIILTPATFLFFEYGTLGICIMVCGYLYKHANRYKFYIFLTAMLTVLFSQMLFWFDLHNFILLIGISIMVYYMLASFDNYEQPVNSPNCLIISRNSIVIYFINLSILHITQILYNFIIGHL